MLVLFHSGAPFDGPPIGRSCAPPALCLALQLHAAGRVVMANDQKPAKGIDARMASAHVQERREMRYPVPVHIEVTGIRNGEVFHARAVTQNVSDWGCGFVMPFELKVEDIIAIRVVTESSESDQAIQSLFQVVRVTEDPEGWLIGAWKLDGKEPWGAALERLHRAESGRENLDSEAREPKQVSSRGEQ